MTRRAAAFAFVVITLRLSAQGGAEELVRAAEAGLSAGKYAAAIEKATAAAALLTASGDRARLGAAENIIGVAHLNRGEYAAAMPRFERAATLAAETGDLAAYVRRRNNLGNVYFYQGQYVRAFESYQTSLAKLAGHEKEPWYLGTRQLALTNLAVLHQQLGQHRKALEIYQEIRALPLQLKPGVEAQMLTNLAIVYRRLGDPQKALETYRRARKLLEANPDAAAALYTLHNVGVVLALDFGDLAGALRTFTEAVGIAERSGRKRELVLERLFRGETLLLMGRYGAARADFEGALADAQSLRLVDEVWTAHYGLGRIQSALGARAEALASFREALRVIESQRTSLGNTSLKTDFLAGKRDVYDALIGELLDEPNPPLAEILQRMEEGRARNLKELLPVERQVVSLAGVQAALDAETAVLAYWMTGSRLAVVWVTRDGAGVAHRRVTKEDGARLTALAQALGRPDSTEWSGLADGASKLLLAGVAPLADARLRRLVVVPDGGLHALPFEVLGSGEGKRLVERFDLSYLPSVHFLRRGGPGERRNWPWQVTVAAFADPLPGKTGGETPFDGGWPRLAHSAEEARRVGALLPGRSRLHIGEENLKAAVFAEETGRTPVLHFATHGAVDTADSRRSRLVFTPAAEAAASQYLFANEIAKLSLSGVELVTLAACESERGRYVRGEGVENFSRAFLAAGAGATVSSLWRVSDQASAELMERFYGGLAAGSTKAAALRAAKTAMIQRHPYYWAGYLLSGDGHTPLTPCAPWWPILGTAGAVLLVAGILLRRKFF